MDDTVRQYLEAQVMTATPQKLRLMLIDGALRCARQAIEQWERHQNENAMESLIHCRSIISELLAGIRIDDSPLNAKVAGVYMFLFRAVTEAQLRRNATKVEEIISVLEIERETWRMVCEQMPGTPFDGRSAAPDSQRTVQVDAPSVAIQGPPADAFAVEA